MMLWYIQVLNNVIQTDTVDAVIDTGYYPLAD
jgi:hypothetical protein